MQVVGGEGSCLSAGEEFCEKFRLQLLSLIEKIAKLMHPIDGRDFLSRWLCKTPYSKNEENRKFRQFCAMFKITFTKSLSASYHLITNKLAM